MLRQWPIFLVAFSLAASPNASWFESWLPTEILPLAQGGAEDPDGAPGLIAFTTFDLERQQIMQNLPCKWMSTTGGEGEARYDFLCKGGTWATVSLMLNKAPQDPAGISRVRLLYREWPENIHPGGGEAFAAQQFLQHVANHFIPASVARDIMEAFWGKSDKKWRVWDTLSIRYTYETPKETRGQFALRRLEIIGRADKLTPRAGTPVPSKPAVTPTEAGLGKAEPPRQPQQPNPELKLAPLPQPRNIPLPTPISSSAPQTDFKPLQLPPQVKPVVTAPEAQPSSTLPVATPAELNTSPEPTSKAPVTPPPSISETLVPDADMLIRNRGKAPAKFDAYNKAEELTRDTETKAAETPTTAPITPAERPTPVDVKPKGEAAESLKAIPMPSMDAEESAPLATPQGPDNWPQGEGLGSPSNNPVPAQPDVDNAAQFQPSRKLPQLKFIPKAVPLEPVDNVIQFEDEKSGL